MALEETAAAAAASNPTISNSQASTSTSSHSSLSPMPPPHSQHQDAAAAADVADVVFKEVNNNNKPMEGPTKIINNREGNKRFQEYEADHKQYMMANNDKEEQRIKKFQKYEADFKQYLMAKYFSDKNINGGNIFDVKVNLDGQTTQASRLPQYQSFLDPASFKELNEKGSLAPTKIQMPGPSNEKLSMSKRNTQPTT